MTRFLLTLGFALLTAITAVAQSAAEAPVEHIVIHPLFAADYVCSEHWEGQLKYPGDALGSDCFVMGGALTKETGFMRPFKSDGSTNEDWYGWRQPVLAPFVSSVAKINVNEVVNKPGQMGNGPATFVVFKRDDGTMVTVAHVADITVKVGDTVAAGQPFAKMSNNGFSRAPHVHVGAWREKTPLQIRFDLRALAKLRDKK
jgi:murein DD-endopeptidase MepM/ murein hydrolase activator NlpD